MTQLAQLQQQAREELTETLKASGMTMMDRAYILKEVDSLIASTYLAALEVTEGAVPEQVGVRLMQDGMSQDFHGIAGWNDCRTETLKNLSSLKKV